VEQVESFKFLGVHITIKLTWSKHTKTVMKRAQRKPIPPQETDKNLAWILRSSKGSTAAPSRASKNWLHHCLVWQLLGLHPQGTTKGNANCPVHHWYKASCHPGPYSNVIKSNTILLVAYTYLADVIAGVAECLCYKHYLLR
jgi:hypothetical protein